MLNKPLVRPIESLLAVFFVWKLALILIALTSPSPGYDTSTDLLFSLESRIYEADSSGSSSISFLDPFFIKIVRWDALYYTKVSERGYLNEQEWAFSWGFTRFVSMVTKGD